MSSTTRIFAAPFWLSTVFLEVAGHRLDELEHVDRLGDVPVEPGLEEVFTIAGHGLRGQRDHRDRLRSLIRLDSSECLDPVDPGKLDVHEDEVGDVLRGQFDRLLAARRLERLVSLRLEDVAEELHVLLIVLHDENPPAAHCADPAGSVNVNVEPRPGSDSTQMRPPCSSTRLLDRASPRPVPSGRSPFLSRACWNSSKIRS